MQNNSCIGIEIIRVTVPSGYANKYIVFESKLTRKLNARYPEYHLGGDIYQSKSDCNTFFILAQYNNQICNADQISVDLENYVQSQYASYFPYTVSRAVTTEQDANLLVDHCFR